jgi:hypothetical protein
MRYYIVKENDMGLDNLWKKNDNETASVEGEFQICGGMFSGHGNDSFRGKVYARIIEDITNENLYDDVIPNEKIKEMADALESTEFIPEYIVRYDIEHNEFKDLVKMFRLHADAGHYLVAFY